MKRLFILSLLALCACSGASFRDYYWDGKLLVPSGDLYDITIAFFDTDAGDTFLINQVSDGELLPGCGAEVRYTIRRGELDFEPFDLKYQDKNGQILTAKMRSGRLDGNRLTLLGFDLVDGKTENYTAFLDRGRETELYSLQKMAGKRR